MNGGTMALAIAGLVGLGSGVYLSTVGERSVGIALMAMGLIFQVLALRQLRNSRTGGSDGQSSAE